MAQYHDSFPFPSLWLRITELKAIDSPRHANRADHLTWLPPECPAGFETSRQTAWQILDPNQVGDRRLSEARDDQRRAYRALPDFVKPYDTSSMFFTTELNSFLEVPYHCQEEHVSQRRQLWEEDGWHRISFCRPGTEDICQRHPWLWMIGHGHDTVQMDARVNITDSWNNLLLPGSFENGVQYRNTLPTCELAGRLTLLLGLVAFATDWDDMLPMIRQSFRPTGTSYYVPTWKRGRPSDQGIINKRGLVIELAFHRRYTQEYISGWEEGRHGPILTSNPDYNED